MRFCALALATVPDVHTARRTMDLHDLDDKSVAKVLFHRRKQQTGAGEQLRWDQQMIAALTVISYGPHGVDILAQDLSTHDEPTMLRTCRAATTAVDRTVSWGGRRFSLPLLRFRSLLHDQPMAVDDNAGAHLDLESYLSPATDDRPKLDTTALKLGLPGLLGHRGDQLVDAWLAGRLADLRAYGVLRALNTFLLALRVFRARGDIDDAARESAARSLRAALSASPSAHDADFLANWEID